MSYPFVSAIICTRNRDDSLCEAVRSVLSQDYPGKLELIVVDQSSSHSAEVTAFLRARSGRLRLIQQTEPNLPQARNVGISAAGGQALLFMDDDVVLPRHALRSLAEHFRTPGLKGVTGLVVSESDPQESLRVFARQLGVANVDKARGLHRVDSFIGALMMISVQAVKSVDGFDPLLGRLTPTAYGEDDDFCYRLRRAGVPLWLDTSIRALHRDYLPGGCGSRSLDADRALKYHIRSMVYIRIKNHRRMGLGGWLQVGRAHIVNRETLGRSPRLAMRNLASVRTAIREVKLFMAQDDRGASAIGSVSTLKPEGMSGETLAGQAGLQSSAQEF